jgi:hypothetical protein
MMQNEAEKADGCVAPLMEVPAVVVVFESSVLITRYQVLEHLLHI